MNAPASHTPTPVIRGNISAITDSTITIDTQTFNRGHLVDACIENYALTVGDAVRGRYAGDKIFALLAA